MSHEDCLIDANNAKHNKMKKRVLIVHNDYQLAGGETNAVRQQQALLEARGHSVYMYVRDNHEIAAYNVLQKALFFIMAFFSWRAYHELGKVVEQFKPDVAHIHNVFPLISPAAYWAIKQRGVPIVQTVHNFRFMCPNGLFFRDQKPCELCKTGNTSHAVRYRCYRNSRVLSALYASVIAVHRLVRTWRQIDRYIALNEFTLQKLIEGRISERDRISVLGNFPSVKIPRFETTLERQPYVVFIGRLSPEKGVEVLINAASKVPELGVKILGDGPLKESLQERTEHMPQVEFLGWIEGDQKYEILQGARALVFPSLWYENFSLVILEALATATPVIASNLGGLPFILEDGLDSLLFTAGDSNALAEKLEVALHEPDRLRSMGQYGLSTTLPRYTEATHYERLMQIYAEVSGE